MPGLRMFYPLARRGRGFRIMVCGGDGTVNWVCQTLARVKFPRPEMAPPVQHASVHLRFGLANAANFNVI